MNMLNYFLEVNLALCAFVIVYLVLLKNETSFALKRGILLAGIAISLLFPVLHVKGAPIALPTIGNALTTVLLPELVVVGVGNSDKAQSSFDPALLLPLIYFAGVALAFVCFALRLSSLAKVFSRSKRTRIEHYIIGEDAGNMPPFSFLNFIYVGPSRELSADDRRHIIAHELVHVRQWHSLDILLINVLGIVFWFNPVLRIYKNIFIQLHEFEADARSVKTEELSDYCNLLARVALLSADMRIANHFSSSLTLKRIQMMRKIKMRIRPWKLVTLTLTLPAFFLLLACQDQILNEVTDVAKTSTMALDRPAEVQKTYEKLQAANPELKLLVVELDEANNKEKIEKIQKDVEAQGKINSVNFIKPESAPERNFLIIAYDERVAAIADRSKEQDVYTVVEESASPSGGIEGLYGFLSKTIQYPADARAKGTEGKVFVSFVVEPDGSLSDVTVVKSVDPLLDAEAMRVIKLSPPWVPGKNSGVTVRQRMVLPVNFRLQDDEKKKVGYFSAPLNPLEHLNPKNKKDDKC